MSSHLYRVYARSLPRLRIGTVYRCTVSSSLPRILIYVGCESRFSTVPLSVMLFTAH